MDLKPELNRWINVNLPAVCYFFGRLMVFLALIPDSYFGTGDLPHYEAWALFSGWPYFNYWSEYPPLFPFLNVGLHKLAGGQTFIYYLGLALSLAFAGSACLVFFEKIGRRIWGAEEAHLRAWVMLAFLLPLPYTWWYFDLIPLAFLLLGLLFMLRGDSWRSGFAVGIGVLLKWFPGFLLASAWRFQNHRQALKISMAALGLTALVWIYLYLASPQMTLASLKGQTARSSWETVWALIDGNMRTGAFLLEEDRLDPSIADYSRGLPARIPTAATLLVFGALGAWLFWQARARDDRALVAFLGLTWIVFLSWSPGWSPQWILYLIPLILLTLPFKPAFLGTAALILVALIEWPTLLAHQAFEGLWVVIPVRMLLFAWLGWWWYRQIRIEK